MNRLNKIQSNLILFVACILSRVVTSIYHIEDIDSLRFALAIQEFSIIKLQPHFPGYPVFCFFSKILFFFTNSIGITFSIIGGVSIFIIIYFILRLADIELNTFRGVFCSALIFFNPLLYIMSNRYMPDLFGAAIALTGIYFLISEENFKWSVAIGFFLVGTLAGIRLSYLPLMIIPILDGLKKIRQKKYLLLSFSLGIFIWLIPLIWITGINDLFLAAFKQTIGHFTDFGGTSITENNWEMRLLTFFRSIWSDGLGGYWFGRHWITLILSIGLIYFTFSSTRVIVNNIKNDRITQLMLFSMLAYAVWILLFQNVIHKSRHVIPIVIVLLYLITSAQNIVIWKDITSKVVSFNFMISLLIVSTVLAIQHKSPSAISKLKDDMISLDPDKTIVSIPLVEYYLKTHGVKANYININDLSQGMDSDDLNHAILIGDHSALLGDNYHIISDSSYYHNPYVNRMWPVIHSFRLQR